MMVRAQSWALIMENWNQFWKAFWQAAEQGPRLFFAPLLGAISQTRIEWKRAQRALRQDPGAGSGSAGTGKF
jgi:hypothetical protein